MSGEIRHSVMETIFCRAFWQFSMRVHTCLGMLTTLKQLVTRWDDLDLGAARSAKPPALGRADVLPRDAMTRRFGHGEMKFATITREISVSVVSYNLTLL